MDTSSLAALVLTVALASSWAMPVARANTYDGLPRPKGFPDAPTVAYGSFPTVYIYGTNQTADCSWYGFANVGYPANIGQQCLTYGRTEVVGDANQGTLRAYIPKYCSGSAGVCYDRVSLDYYCFQACYFLTNSTLAVPPVTAPASPPPPSVLPPPAGTPPSVLPPPGTPPPVLSPPDTPPSVLPPPGTPAAVVPPPGTPAAVVPPPPAPAAPRTAGAGLHAPSVMLLAFCAGAVNLVIRL